MLHIDTSKVPTWANLNALPIFRTGKRSGGRILVNASNIMVLGNDEECSGSPRATPRKGLEDMNSRTLGSPCFQFICYCIFGNGSLSLGGDDV